MSAEDLPPPSGIRDPDRLARSESLLRLRYPRQQCLNKLRNRLFLCSYRAYLFLNDYYISTYAKISSVNNINLNYLFVHILVYNKH
jgi:hypothetical protein